MIYQLASNSNIFQLAFSGSSSPRMCALLVRMETYSSATKPSLHVSPEV
jgi:hypothetical protein